MEGTMKLKSIVAGAALASVLFTTPAANAAVMLATFRGTITSGADATGIFGNVGSSLAGEEVLAVFKYDTDLGNVLPFVGRQGGPAYSGGHTNPMLDAWIEINDIEDHLSLPASSSFALQVGGANAHYEAVGGVPCLGQLPSCWADLSFLLMIDTNVAAPVSDLDSPFVQALSGASGLALKPGYYSFDLQLTNFQVSSAVPEPATWAMMIVGFGLVGSTLRSSRGRRLAA